jgi:aromatic-L-amino-acid/L-tryptophan decarboxylase
MDAKTSLPQPELTLDPQDWSRLRQLGHRMLDDMFAYLETARQREAWKPVPAEVCRELDAKLPLEPRDPEQVYADFQRLILPYPTGNIHPRFWGWVIGSGTAFGMLAQLLEGAMNCNVFGADQGAVQVERQVVGWFKQALGYAPEASGILTTGASASNLVGLAVARHAMAEIDISTEGVRAAPRRMVLYASAETHSSVGKAVELLGLGSGALRHIPVDSDFRICTDLLRDAIRQDREAGRFPFCLVGNAGTVNTGAFDPLEELAGICRDEHLWFHVDGAFGGFAALSDALSPLVRGMQLADSLALDLHKWMHVQYDAGCALIRRPHDHHAAFTRPASYLHRQSRGLSGGGLWFHEYGFELSRGFRALRVWMALQEHGFRKYGQLVEQNVRQASYLASLVKDSAELELLAPVPLNIVCFRYTVPGWDEPALAALNQEILADLQESGVAVPSSTLLGGRFALRVAICNHRSRREDFDLLVREVLRLGRGRAEKPQPAVPAG